MELPGVDISIVDVNDRVVSYRADIDVRLGSFYTEECFYPFLIASMYSRIAKALYVECGTVFRVDAATVFGIEIGEAVVAGFSYRDDNLIGFDTYVSRWVGVSPDKYIAPQLMLLNLNAMRKNRTAEKFKRLLTGYNFDTIYPAADYLNFLSKGCTTVLDKEWEKNGVRYAVTFSPYRQPWKYVNTSDAQEFWDMARKTAFYEDVRDEYLRFNEDKKKENEALIYRINEHISSLEGVEGGFYATLGENYLITK